MFNRNRLHFLVLTLLGVFVGVQQVQAEDTSVVSVDASSLPINVADQTAQNSSADQSKASVALVSPSQAQAVQTDASPKVEPQVAPSEGQSMTEGKASATGEKDNTGVQENQKPSSDFDFDLKLKAVNSAGTVPSAQAQAPVPTEDSTVTNSVPASAPAQSATTDQSAANLNDTDMPKTIQYTANPIENLGNSVLSEMDSDLFSQMSEIEKSVTLLTLELRREKIRNEIEAQKALREKASADIEKQRAENQLKILEKQKQIEAQVVKEKQLLIDKEKIFEVLKQRKLLNAYMNQMLVAQQEWLKEKEALYAKLEAVEQEKRDLVVAFKKKIDTVLEASAQNIQTAEAARANFERIIKGLKARNDQLRKRIEADAQIIKNAKSTLYLKSQSIEELKDRNAAILAANAAASESATNVDIEEKSTDVDTEEEVVKKLSAEYAILGITGRSGVMSIDLIDASGQPLTLKMGSPLPTGHVVSEIGSDYAKFTRDGKDDYLYVGHTIDGVVPTLGLLPTKSE